MKKLMTEKRVVMRHCCDSEAIRKFWLSYAKLSRRATKFSLPSTKILLPSTKLSPQAGKT